MYDKKNIFAKIINKEVSCNVVFENEFALIFHDLNPAAPIHLLAIPKGEYVSFADFSMSANADEISGLFAAISHITSKLGISASGYRLITNHGKDALQTVPHFHIHILAGKKLGGLLENDSHHGSL